MRRTPAGAPAAAPPRRRSARKCCTPTEKFGLQTRPVPPRSTASRARSSIAEPAGRARPLRLRPSRARRSIFSMAVAGVENSTAASMPRKFSLVMPSKFALLSMSRRSLNVESVFRRELFDQPAHFAVAHDGEVHSHFPQPWRLRAQQSASPYSRRFHGIRKLSSSRSAPPPCAPHGCFPAQSESGSPRSSPNIGTSVVNDTTVVGRPSTF